MSLLTCANNLKGNDYAVDFLQTTITVSLLFRNYNFINNYLYADLDKWRVRLDLTNKDYSMFREPDLNNQLTAIALQDDGRMFKKLKLVRE